MTEQINFNLATEEYESIVTNCANNDSPVEIFNRHITHAAILTRHIILKTEKGADILTGSMPELFFNEIKHSLETPLQKKVPVRIIFMNRGTACPDLIDLATRYPNLQVFEIREEFRSEVKAHVCHFCVSDNKRFRIESIHPDKDFLIDPSIKATASFNQPEVAKVLHKSFNDLLALSDSIKKPASPTGAVLAG